MKRKTIKIDEERCVGCGQCANTCHQGAIQMVNGKARLVREDHCDGLGRCLGACPVDAISFVEKEVPDAGPAAAPAPAAPKPPAAACGCPGMQEKRFTRNIPSRTDETGETPSALSQWPIQLHLVNPASPQFVGEDLLIAASCTAFSTGGFHQGLLAGRKLVIACPKLDNTAGYLEKLTALLQHARPASLTVARMEVPCCGGLVHLVLQAHQQAQSDVPVREVIIGLDGTTRSDREIVARAG